MPSVVPAHVSLRCPVNLLPLLAALILSAIACVSGPVVRAQSTATTQSIRFATFNVSLYDAGSGKLLQRLSQPGDQQAATIAEIIQRVQPDVLLLNEFDYDEGSKAVAHFQSKYLAIGQNVSGSPEPAEPIKFPYSFAATSNTGQHSGFDLDQNGRVETTPGRRDYGGDCWGYGEYPGKYAMVLLSRYPIATDQVRTFRKFLWKDMPASKLPQDWYTPEILTQFPLSSKSHWDVPIEINGQTIHVLASHPTPPTFDGPEDRNGRRNHDEIRFWADYLEPEKSDYFYDDNGAKGGLLPGELFVVMGDLNGDPLDGQGKEGIARLLASSRVSTELTPSSAGGAEQAKLQGGANSSHRGDPSLDTLDAADERGPGNLRVDYVIPAKGLKTLASGVFWPKNEEALFKLVGTYPFPSSDHRLVWIEVKTP